jgi:hypothetical protein
LPMPLPALYVDENGNLRDAEPTADAKTFDEAGRELDPHALINPTALVARLQAHAMGDKSQFMDQSQIAASRTLLDFAMVRAAQRTTEKPVLESIDIPATVSDDDALKAYLAMLGA